MGYLYLLASVISGSIKGFFGKKVSNATSGLSGAVFSNFIRMLFCIPVGLIFVLFDGGLSSLAVPAEVLWIALISGVCTSAFIVTWLLAVQRTAYTAVDAFISMGILVPVLLSAFFYGEGISLSQSLGLFLLILAVVIMSIYSSQIKGKIGMLSLLLLLAVGLSSGLSDFSYKIFGYAGADTPASTFNLYIYIFSAATLLIVFLLLRLFARREKGGESEERQQLWDGRKTVYIAIMAIFLFANSYFKTLATELLDAVLVYPLSQGMAILFAMLMSALFFKEKIKPLSVIGLAVMFAALLFINVFSF